MLDNDFAQSLTDIQRKCCGFIQLSSFITPGDPQKTPFRGFHPFSVFVIFPIHVTPWTLLCKKMTERRDSQFQPNSMLSCTGKVAGFLNHKFMVQPPQLPQDYVFIVVPDTWTFHDKTTKVPTSAPSPITSLDKKSSTTDPFDKSKFLSPSKRLPRQPSTPAAPAPTTLPLEPATSPTALSSDGRFNSSLSSKRPIDDDIPVPIPSAKKPCTASLIPNTTNTLHHDASSNAPNDHNPQHTNNGTNTYPSPSIDPTSLNLVPYSVPTLPPQPHDETSRPHRNRQVPKKYSTVD